MQIKLSRRAAILGICTAASSKLIVPGAVAQEPQRSVNRSVLHFVVPFPPGGGSDLVARAIVPKLEEALERTIIIDNRAGANVLVGSNFVAKSDPNGNTILITTIAHAVNPSLYKQLPYDTQKDFAPISRIADAPLLLVVNPSVPVKSVQELITFAKSNPNTLMYASPGIGSPAHLAGEMFKKLADVEIRHIPYKGSGQATTDLLGNQVNMTFSSLGVAAPLVRSGMLRAMGVTTERRSLLLPDVPTIAEVAIPGYSIVSWQGILAPARTPVDMVNALNQGFVKALSDPASKKLFADNGYEAVSSTPEEFSQFISSEMKRWSELVQKLGIKPE